MKIGIAIPHEGTLVAETAQCLGSLLMATVTQPIRHNGVPARVGIEQLFGRTGSLEAKRTRLAYEAIERKTDYLLWIDSDQTFPADALLRLMMRDKPIVGGIYHIRGGTGETSAFGLDGQRIKRRKGLEEVASVGFGFLLMKTPVLAKIPKPWFATTFNDKGETATTEDVHFCEQARRAGFPIFVDHDMTIGHFLGRVYELPAT